jgi:hypothetical protein
VLLAPSEDRARFLSVVIAAMRQGLGLEGGTAWSSRKRMLTLRIVQMITVILFVTLPLATIFVQRLEIRVISILQIYYLLRVRRRMRKIPVGLVP